MRLPRRGGDLSTQRSETTTLAWLCRCPSVVDVTVRTRGGVWTVTVRVRGQAPIARTKANLGLALHECAALLVPLLPSDAANRITVRLPTGGLGILTRVSGDRATVWTAGRHERYPLDVLHRSEIDLAPRLSREVRYRLGLGDRPDHPEPSSPVDVS